ncbi:hypothetical protein GUJ93_ZPchr0003g18401 [Zizania palustris]|uniref:Uncharacterized protein n=1 Tax=Zizania palustris TaxID=103762 RepID=A0A8J5VX33_ZIZPA|nr:hypothetical protein GUJ93_ZPchr0003g18401 [Zizania palustris]
MGPWHRQRAGDRAAKLPKKYPCYLADGNELLRFYDTIFSFSLGTMPAARGGHGVWWGVGCGVAPTPAPRWG